MDLGAILETIQKVLENGQEYISAILGVCSALIVLAMLIPGEQPEKFLRQAVDFLAKFSRKPKA